MPAMRSLEERLNEAVDALVHNVPGPVVGTITIAFYPGLGLLLPVALQWSQSAFVIANLVGVTVAAVLSLGWLLAQVESARRRHLVEWTTDLRNLDSDEFEWFVGEVFRREGWEVAEKGRPDAPDGNIDLELSRDGRRQVVQCKRWESWFVGVDAIRAFGGTLRREGLDNGFFVTLSSFTEAARAEAPRIGITLIDGPALFKKVEGVRHQERCPVCGQPMRFDRSSLGWWFHCVTPGCGYKRDLGSDPGKAVELLTEQPLTQPRADRTAATPRAR